MSTDLLDLIKAEGWELKKSQNKHLILAYGEEYPLTHPAQIHLKRYREATNPDMRYLHMKSAHDYLWPQTEWHYWTEDRFREHCAGWNYMGWAGGASTAKSFDAAKIVLLFWLANPRKRGVIVASTTLESLGARVWGYTTQLLSKIKVKMPFQYLGGTAPKILYPSKRSETEIRDTIHGVFAVAAKQGKDESAISSWIGRHPEDALMVILDECTDLNPAIAKAFPNLDSSEKPFQVIGIGNSNSIHDLHGAICTPSEGWPSINPMLDTKWSTTQKNGICMFFSCYNSPAVHERDPVKAKVLGRFLITADKIAEKEKELGKDSDSFWRFVLGYWRTASADGTVVSKEFLAANNVTQKAEWLGIHPLQVVGGLDAAFSTGGDKCVLRLGYLGQMTDGSIVLDFRDRSLLFIIDISATRNISAELQIAEQVISILHKYGCDLGNVCIDANGQGRALGGTLYLKNGGGRPPIKIYSTRTGSAVQNSFDVVPKKKDELWFDFRNFVEHGQIKGLDAIASAQFAARRLIQNPKTLKQELESKSDYKKRMAAIMPSLAHSPDEADAAALCLQAAIINYGFGLGQRREVGVMDSGRMAIDMVKREIRMKQQEHFEGGRGEVPVATFGGSVEDFVKNYKAI